LTPSRRVKFVRCAPVLNITTSVLLRLRSIPLSRNQRETSLTQCDTTSKGETSIGRKATYSCTYGVGGGNKTAKSSIGRSDNVLESMVSKAAEISSANNTVGWFSMLRTRTLWTRSSAVSVENDQLYCRLEHSAVSGQQHVRP